MVSAKKTLAQPAMRGDYWSCVAPVPAQRGDYREPCGTQNQSTNSRCDACGAPRNFNPNSVTTFTSSTKAKNMSEIKPTSHSTKPTTTHAGATPNGTKPTTKPAAVPTAAVAPAVSDTSAVVGTPVVVGTTAAGNPVTADTGKVKDPANKRLKFSSTKNEEYYVRVRPDLFAKFGAPLDPWGVMMVLKAGADAPSKKALRIDNKEAEKKLLETMTDEQKLAYAKEKRAKNVAARDAKKAEQKAKLMAELKAELEAEGKIVKT